MLKEKLDSIPFFFIIGRPRSGTTMLSTLLDANKNTAMPIESKIIVHLYFKYKKTRNWDNNKLLEFYNSIFEQPKIETWMINKEKLKSEILELGEDANFQRLVKLIYLNYVSFFDKSQILVIGDKNPGYSYVISHFKILLTLFPDAKIIHLTRDYRDHYLSMKKVDFEGNHLSLVCYRWQFSFRKIREIMKDKPNQYYFIKYEDLVTFPEIKMTEVCNFLGIEYHASMLEYYKIKEKVLSVYSEEDVMKYHSNLFQPINPNFVNKWKEKLSVEEIKKADIIVGKYAEEAGYERRDMSNRFKFLRYTLPDIIYSQLWLFYKSWYDKFFGKNNKKKEKGVMSKLYFKVFRR